MGISSGGGLGVAFFVMGSSLFQYRAAFRSLASRRGTAALSWLGVSGGHAAGDGGFQKAEKAI